MDKCKLFTGLRCVQCGPCSRGAVPRSSSARGMLHVPTMLSCVLLAVALTEATCIKLAIYTATSLRGLTRNRPRLKMSTFATVGPNKTYGPLAMPTAVSFLTTEQKSSMWKRMSIWPEIRYRYEYGVCVWAPCTRQCKACFG